MKKILVVVDSINQEDSSGSKCNVAIIKNLAQAGYQVKVYHHSRKTILIEGAACVKINVDKLNWIYIFGGFLRFLTKKFNIVTTPFIEKNIGFSPAFFSDVHDFTKALKKDSFNPDLVLTLSKAASFRPHKALLNIKKWHHKWLAYVHDPYPFHLYPEPYSFIASGHEIKEKFLIEISEKAAFSAFPSLLLKEWMGQFAPNFLQTGVVIPHQLADKGVFSNNLDIFPDYFKQDSFSLLHAGALLGERDPSGLIAGFFKFLQNNPVAKNKSQLILIGSTSVKHKKVFEQYNEASSNFVFIDKNRPFNEVNFLQNTVAVNIILEAKSAISPFLPGKFPHCVAANKKMLVLGPKNSETRRLLGSDYEYWSEIDEVDSIAKRIEKLYFEWEINPSAMALNKPELATYLGANYLKIVLNSLLHD